MRESMRDYQIKIGSSAIYPDMFNSRLNNTPDLIYQNAIQQLKDIGKYKDIYESSLVCKVAFYYKFR
ncbi:hypothetical protein CHS0354_035116, partial [Potamilus streckersoni]